MTRIDISVFSWLVAISLAFVPSARAADSKPAISGERIALECFSCHRRDGKDMGIPGIVGMKEADIVNALTLYKTGLRTNKVMMSVTTSLEAAQLQAVAAYMSSLSKK